MKLDILYEAKEDLLKHCECTALANHDKNIIISVIEDKILETRRIPIIGETDNCTEVHVRL